MIIKFLTLITLLICIIQCKSQIIINMAGGNGVLPSNYNETGQYYEKDINNNLDNFVGTWEYVNGNEKFQIILTKIIKYHINDSDISLNYYTDGIKYQYKKFNNNILIFESPVRHYPSFDTKDGIILDGGIKDYGRITKNIYMPLTNELVYAGGGPVDANCEIIKISSNQIKFHLYLRQHFPNYNIEVYAGQPVFSLPNDVTLTKVP
ncbi:DUF6705 family protein [Chryseobacterium sp. GP-SGM7]|uniref:DUF6705 family protein n=1 Tax=Chryseobacterium sp. GP-SGM7 TaxID=3411323 RepID=UPI003B9654C6